MSYLLDGSLGRIIEVFTEENMVKNRRDILRPEILLFPNLTFSFNDINWYSMGFLAIVELRNKREDQQVVKLQQDIRGHSI